MKTIVDRFKNPDNAFRGAPFWAWNGKLDQKELIRQIQIFKEMGYGGFFMHSRVGLATEYLGREWFDCVKACIAEAEKLGMKASIYDEDRWPSGSAGGKVTADERFGLHFCKYEILEKPEDAALGGRTLACFQASVLDQGEKVKVLNAERLAEPVDFRPGKDQRLLRFACVPAMKTPWFNGETYLDALNPDAVRRFLDITHEAYAREVGQNFGKTVPAIFSDEPNFNNGLWEYPIPWTDRIPELFHEKYGRNLLDLLPEIFLLSLKKYSCARLQFMDLITSMFVNAFSRQIGDWCDKHGVVMTGHVLMEDSLLQAFFVGSAMRFYEYMQCPGIDLLTEHRRLFSTVKQCTSMAHQCGRKRRLTETYGCTGWSFPFMGHKALGDWQYALGINFRCQHLAWYTAEGEAKRDYPSSLSYQSSWYRTYPVVEDYFARLGAVLSAGEEKIHLLVIHPIESLWLGMDFDGYRNEFRLDDIQTRMNTEFGKLTDRLLEAKLDFDFGEEEVISRRGAVDSGLLRVGCARYRAVLIPELLTIRKSTLKLLQAFADGGGQVVFLGKPPAYMDGELSEEPARVFTGFQAASLPEVLTLLAPRVRTVSVTGPDGQQIGPVLARVSGTEDEVSVFLVNYGEEFSKENYSEFRAQERMLVYPQVTVEVAVPDCGRVYELNAADGNIYAVEASRQNGCYRFSTSFDRLQSRLFLISRKELQTSQRPPLFSDRNCVSLDSPWQYELDEDNTLVLDHADWAMDGNMMGQNEYILAIDDRLREAMGLPKRGGTMVQPWKAGRTPAGKTVRLELRYHFQVQTVPSGDCCLAMEHPECCELVLNGQLLPQQISGWWCDKAIRCIRIPVSWLRAGENSLEIRMPYDGQTFGLEACYLRGRFGVSEDRLVRLPEVLNAGDWCLQGLPYYAGNVTYKKTIHVPAAGGMIRLGNFGGVLQSVQISGGEEKLLPWAPFTCGLPAGEVQLAVKVYGSRRNALGPFFCKDKWPVNTGPYCFKWLDSPVRQLVPSGMLEEPVLSMKSDNI